MKRILPVLLSACALLAQCKPAPDTIQTGFCPVSGDDHLYYEVKGSGTPVILLHGHSLDTRMWDGQFETFARTHRTIRFDFRGYGRSSEPREGFDFTHLDDLLALMDSLHIDRAHIVGLSMGAFVAGDMIALHPERLLSCTMASGMIRNSPGPSEPMDAAERARRDEEIAALRAQGIDRMKAEWIDGLIAGGGSRREEIRPALEEIIGDWTAWQPLHYEPRLIYGRDAIRVLHERRATVPALILLGGKDVERGATTHPSMLDDLPFGRCEVLPDCGHMCNMEQPEAFNEAVLRFIDEVDREDAVVRCVVAGDGSGDFTTIQAAVDAQRSFKPEGRALIFVKKGIYEEKVLIHSHKAEISLVGEDRDSTVIVWHDHGNIPAPAPLGGTIGTFLSYTLRVDGPGFICENLTVSNDAMTHFNPNWFEDGRNDANVAQAVALHVEADRATFRGCRFLGFQDTIYTGNPDGREYFEDCYIEGTVDFIFGPATCWFERCHIHALRSGYLTAASTPADHPYGYVFNRCRVTAREGVSKEWLGRPWRAWAYTLWKECDFDLDLHPEGWNNWGNPANELTARYLEYRCTGRGADRSQRAAWSRELSDAEAAEVTPEAAFRHLQIDWLP